MGGGAAEGSEVEGLDATREAGFGDCGGGFLEGKGNRDFEGSGRGSVPEEKGRVGGSYSALSRMS